MLRESMPSRYSDVEDVDLLPVDEVEEQVERSFEAGEPNGMAREDAVGRRRRRQVQADGCDLWSDHAKLHWCNWCCDSCCERFAGSTALAR
jgi:hypothetical protein